MVIQEELSRGMFYISFSRAFTCCTLVCNEPEGANECKPNAMRTFQIDLAHQIVTLEMSMCSNIAV